MSRIESSPLSALESLYVRLANDANYGVAAPGYSTQKITFSVVLNPDGTLHDIQDEREPLGKKTLPRQLLVPGQAKPSGQGLNPGFLWDNSGYLLGYKVPDEDPATAEKDAARAQLAYAKLRERHLAAESQVNDAAFTAVCTFLRQWTPARADAHRAKLDEYSATGFGVFRLRGEQGYVHERPAVRKYWESQISDSDSDGPRGQCLITGEVDVPLAQLVEPAIKGVRDAQSSGAKLVSFNCDSFTSYRPEHKSAQALVSPISEAAAFRHATALNALLNGPRSRLHRIQIGDATTVFWTAQPTVTESFLAAFLGGHVSDDQTAAQDESLRQQLEIFLRILQRAGGRDFADLNDDPQTPFHLLGLAPNAARISVRFWHVSTLGGLVDRLRDHYAALRLVRSFPDREPEFPAVWQLLRETAREQKDVSPLLGGALMRAVLNGTCYPTALATAVVNRIRADRNVSYLRAAILKAFLTRKQNTDLPMSLDPDRLDPAYRLGRLFAALEKTQEDALPNINATIRDRFYSAASATPRVVFPRLLRTYQHHLSRAAAERGMGLKVNREKLVQGILSALSEMPPHLTLEGQSLFALGYYHQRQAFFPQPTEPSTP